jgi:hypothetical protein
VALKSLLAIGTFFTAWMSIFAMNIDSGLNHWRAPGFFWVYVSVVVVIVFLCAAKILSYMTSWYIRFK